MTRDRAEKNMWPWLVWKGVESINKALIAFVGVFAVLSASCCKCSTLTHTFKSKINELLENLLYWCTGRLYSSLVYGHMLWSEVMAFMGIYRWHVESLNIIYCVCHSAAFCSQCPCTDDITDIWSYRRKGVIYCKVVGVTDAPYWQITECITSSELLHRVINADWQPIKYEVCDWDAMKYWCWSLSVCCRAGLL